MCVCGENACVLGVSVCGGGNVCGPGKDDFCGCFESSPTKYELGFSACQRTTPMV